MSDFGERLRKAFGNRTNVLIAKQLGVTTGAVSNYMAGRVPDAKTLQVISILTKCNLHWLLTGDGPETTETPDTRRFFDILEERGYGVQKAKEEYVEAYGEDISNEEFLYQVATEGLMQLRTERDLSVIDDDFNSDHYLLNLSYVLERTVRAIIQNELQRRELPETFRVATEEFYRESASVPRHDLGTIDEFDVEESYRRNGTLLQVMDEWFKHEGRELPADYLGALPSGWGAMTFEERVDAIRDQKQLLDEVIPPKRHT